MEWYSCLSPLRKLAEDLPIQERKDLQVRALQEAVLSENGHYLRELEYSIAEVVYYVLFDFIIKERYQFNRTIKDHWSNPKSAWYLLHKIRYMKKKHASSNLLSGIVEVDETYYGGRKRGKRGRGSENKAPIFGLVQRGGRLSITLVKDTKRKTLEPIIHKRVKMGSHIMSDEWWAYSKLSKDYKHNVVNHGIKEYVVGRTYTNTIEGAWSHLKRSIMGTYHRPSKKHLDKYCAEFEFNYNTRNNPPEVKFKKIIDKNLIRVSYKDITGT